MDNIRGPRGDGDDSGGKYNPFRILEIGESMVRYCDGIRIKNYNFLAILTSDRLVLIESAQQSAGTIAKEIPVNMIKGAVMERDEKNRPGLSVSMEVGGQTRLMKLVFTGLIAEPETECREWFTAINGYPPEPEEVPEPVPVAPPAPAPPEPSPVVIAGAAVAAAKIESEIPEKAPESVILPAEPALTAKPVPTPIPVLVSAEATPPTSPAPVITPVATESVPPIVPVVVSVPADKQRISVPAPAEDSIQICLEKPDIRPIRLARKTGGSSGQGSGKTRFCLHCGTKIPGLSRFCPVCGKTQV